MLAKETLKRQQVSDFPITTYRLAPRGPASRGLVCDQDGATLGPAPLVFPVTGPGGRP